MDLSKKYPFLKEKDAILLEKVISEIKKIPKVLSIVQIGSSTYAKKYNDIDIIVFFDRFLVPSNLQSIRAKYKGTKIYLEGSSMYYKDFNPGFKVFIKFFLNLKNKKFLYGKNPFSKKNIILKKTDVMAYIWYHYHICEQYNQAYESALSNSLNAMLSYINIFPENKEQTLKLFIRKFPTLARYLPKNHEKFLRRTTKGNFKDLATFFEQCLRYFEK